MSGEPLWDWKEVSATIPIGAHKRDQGKAQWSLIPWEPLAMLADLYTAGAVIYPGRNWEKGMDWERVFNALCRHLTEWRKGIDYDPETGGHHLLAVVFHCFTIVYYTLHGLGRDFTGPSLREALMKEDKPDLVFRSGLSDEQIKKEWHDEHIPPDTGAGDTRDNLGMPGRDIPSGY